MFPVFYYYIEVLETVTGKEWIKCPGDEKNMQMNQKIYGNCFEPSRQVCAIPALTV